MRKSRIKYLCIYVKIILVGNLKKSINTGLFVTLASLVILSLIGILSVLSNGPASSPTTTIFNAPMRQIFVTNWASDSVSVINASNYTVVKIITGFKRPTGIVYLPNHGEVFVTNSGSNTVSVINTTTDTVIKNITVGLNPSDVVFYTNRSEAYVSNYNNSGNSTISVINTTTYAVKNTIPMWRIGGGVEGLAISPNGKYLLAAMYTTKYLAVINATTNEIVHYIQVGKGGHTPYDVVISPNGAYAYASTFDASYVYVINMTTYEVIKNITIGGSSDIYGSELAISPDGSAVIATNVSQSSHILGTASVINTTTDSVEKVIYGLPSAYAVAFSPGGGEAIISEGFGGRSISIINTITYEIVKRISVGGDPAGIAIT